MSYRARIFTPVDPPQLAMLQRVFDGTCRNRGFAPHTFEAEELAVLLIELYSHGVRKEPHLRAMLN